MRKMTHYKNLEKEAHLAYYSEILDKNVALDDFLRKHFLKIC